MFERYSRQLPLIGEEGQEKLSKAKVLVVGAGGLGSAVIAYLAAAGVGRIGIIDGDVVEESNLQRQIIHAGNVGENKAESAAMFVDKLNPEVTVDVYPYRLNEKNAKKIIGAYDVVAGCPDSFTVRYTINDVAIPMRKPFVHAAVYGWEGEVGVFFGKPCYRCYLPKVSETTDRAIIGTTAGTFGCMQASEIIKLICGKEVLAGRIFRLDLATFESLILKIPPRPDCPVCGGNELRRVHREGPSDS